MGDNAGVMTDALTWAGTFHGIGARLLRDYADQIGLDPAFTIHDREDSADLMNLVAARTRLLQDRKPLSRPRAPALPSTPAASTPRLPIEQVLGKSFPVVLRVGDGAEAIVRGLCRSQAAAERARLRRSACSTGRRPSAIPALADDIGGRFDHVLVDEYQDTNRLQSSILLALKPGGRGLTVVGDDAQSIYSFRAATVRNILDFPGQFSPPASIITLDRNYRSTQTDPCRGQWRHRARQRALHQEPLDRAHILHEAAARLGARRGRPGALHRRAGAGEPRSPAPSSSNRRCCSAHHSHSGPLEVELTRRNIPFVKFGGLKFLDAAHIKDMLALLRFVENPRDRVAGFRLMHLIPGVGPTLGAARARSHGRDQPIRSLALAEAPISARAGDDWQDFVDAVTDLRQAAPAGRPNWSGRASGTNRISTASTRTPAPGAPISFQLEQIAGGYPSRERFLTELTLDPPDATSDQAGVPLLDEDYLILSTIHSAKGQEWKSVFVLNVVDGCMPSGPRRRHIGRDRGGAPPALCRDDTRQRTIFTSWCRSASSPMARTRRATGTSTPARTRFIPDRLLGLFEKDKLAALGRPGPRPALRLKVFASTSAPACAGCGAELQYPL